MKHGLLSTYDLSKCRCAECVKAKTDDAMCRLLGGEKITLPVSFKSEVLAQFGFQTIKKQ